MKKINQVELVYCLVLFFSVLLGGCKQNQQALNTAHLDSLFAGITSDTVSFSYLNTKNTTNYSPIDSVTFNILRLKQVPVIPSDMDYSPDQSATPIAIGKIKINPNYSGYLVGFPHQYGWINVALKTYNTSTNLVGDSSYWVGAYFGDGGAEYFLTSTFFSATQHNPARIFFVDSTSVVTPEDTLITEKKTFVYTFDSGLFRK